MDGWRAAEIGRGRTVAVSISRRLMMLECLVLVRSDEMEEEGFAICREKSTMRIDMKVLCLPRSVLTFSYHGTTTTSLDLRV